MKFNFLSILKYTLSFLAAVALFWYLYRDQNIDETLARFSSADYRWIFFSMFLSASSHWFRAWRWQIMLRPVGYETGIFKPFLAVMVGYVANMILPRMGEISRCAVLKKTNDIPIEISFGAVVAERIIDVIVMLSLCVLGVALEFDKIGGFLINIFGSSSDALTQKLILLFVVFLLGVLGLLLLFLLREKIKKMAFYQKIRNLFSGLKDGFLSVGKLSASDRLLFLGHTVAMWILYYTTSYVLFFSIAETSNLDWHCAFAVLVMTALSVTAPVQGGIGVYHWFVSVTLMAYGIEEKLSKDFAFMMHSSQVFMIVVLGGLSFLASMLISKKSETAK
jgi:glycosyltransferase 2 family protein